MIAHVGTYSLSQSMPVVGISLSSLISGITTALERLEADLLGLTQLQANLVTRPPSLAGNISAVQQLLVGLQAAAAVGLPGVDFQLGIVLAQIGKIAADIAALWASIGLAKGLLADLGALGIDLYAYAGAVNALGSELAGAVSSGLPGGAAPTGPCNALILAVSDPVSWDALARVFKVA